MIEDVLGVSAEDLYWDWREYITERYDAQVARIQARGEVTGHELSGSYQEWEYTDPDAKDAYEGKKRYDRERAREASGRYQWEPWAHPTVVSMLKRARIYINAQDDDQVFADRATRVGSARGEQSKEMSTYFMADFEHGRDFVPGTEGSKHVCDWPRGHHLCGLQKFRGPYAELDGYNWKELYYYEMPIRDDERGNRTVATRDRRPGIADGFFGADRYEKGSWYAIPNTKRGADPSVSPDGKKVAYFEYTDGTLNLVTINVDGTDKKYLTTYDDGTWLQTADWSPDGKASSSPLPQPHAEPVRHQRGRPGSSPSPGTSGRSTRPLVDRWKHLLHGRARRRVQHLPVRPGNGGCRPGHQRHQRCIHAADHE